jgi:uncharacterized protein YkwD
VLVRAGAPSDALLLPFDDPGHSGGACPGAREPGSVVSRNRFVLALALALFMVVAPPAGATVRHLTRRHTTARHIPSSCPGADLRPTEQDLGGVRAATLCLVNRERARQGERPLAPNERLEQAAQGHTEAMALDGYFKHVGRRGDTPLGRMRAAGYISSSQARYQVAENIGWGTLGLATPRAIVAAWMASLGHRANILDARFRDTAISVSPDLPFSLVCCQAGAIYTQDFAS